MATGRRSPSQPAASASATSPAAPSGGRERFAKAGNINNALFHTEGEFIAILDADQVPQPEFLDATLGYFADASVAFVQTPQEFWNVGRADPLGSRAELFYGPIQQGKDGRDAAFFCGSNAVLRREAVMALAVTDCAGRTLGDIRRVLRDGRARLVTAHGRCQRVNPGAAHVVADVQQALERAATSLRRGGALDEVVQRFAEDVRLAR